MPRFTEATAPIPPMKEQRQFAALKETIPRPFTTIISMRVSSVSKRVIMLFFVAGLHLFGASPSVPSIGATAPGSYAIALLISFVGIT